jgi:hypothetical protein
LAPAEPVFDLPLQAAPLTLHLQQIKRQQLLMLNELKRTQGVSRVAAELSQHLAAVEHRQSQMLEALADVSATVQHWNARFSAIGAEITPLLQSDAIADFVTQVGRNDP